MKSSIVLTEEKVPEKGLSRETVFKYIPDVAISNLIFEDFKKHLNKPLVGSAQLDIRIHIKEYSDTANKFWYDKEEKTNDT